ncbi:MAG: hydroxymethylbilane synthase [Bariatricus sp.]
MQSVIRIGSRTSRLAVIQAEIVKNLILQSHPELTVEIVTMKTTGDKILDRSLDKIGGKGLFVKELDRALLEGRIDLAVHSLKDMPSEIPEELPVFAFPKRGDPRDVMVYSEQAMKTGRVQVIGTGSKRRQIQMADQFPDCRFEGIRGNIQTRLKKLETESYDALVLAAAGLQRLEMESRIGRYFDVEEMIPAAGQGILAVQGRKGENWIWEEILDHRGTRAAALAERQFIAELGGGCTSPAAAHARAKGEELCLSGLYYRESDGQFFKETITGTCRKAQEAGALLAKEMRQKYGD